jgi:hypothetical protein
MATSPEETGNVKSAPPAGTTARIEAWRTKIPESVALINAVKPG